MRLGKVWDYKKTEEYYNKYGSWYDRERIKGYYEFINANEIELVKRYAVNKDVLEIGCGTGIILGEVGKFTHSAQGIDLSKGMLALAKEKGLRVQLANATSLPFADKSFDVVYSFKVLAHIPEIKQVISEAARVVNDDGTLVLEFYNPYSLKRVTNWFYNLIHQRGVYIRYDSCFRIKSYLPKEWQVVENYGIKVLALGKKLSTKPFFVNLEKKLATIFGKRIGGYLVVIIKKKNV